MEILDSVRYWLGVVLLSTWVPAMGCWILIHPLVKFWRKVGQKVMWPIVAVTALSGVALLVIYRDPLMGADLGFRVWLLAPAILMAGFGTYLDLARRKHLTTRILTGGPEIEGNAANLLTDGPYARIRHPRYVAITMAYFGCALFVNYAGLYIYLLVSLGMVYLIVVLEEKELNERFGAQYQAYAEKVPRFIPK